jgi:hypothetical protein
MFWALPYHAVAADDLCQNHEFTVWTGPVQSHWQEYSRVGESLLTERGQLMKAAVGWRASCGHWTFQLEGSRADGDRLYKGVTNHKQPVQTISEIRTDELDAQLWHPLGQSWALGGRYLWRKNERDLKSVGRVQGYLERYNQTALALGLQHTKDFAGHGRLQTRIWMGSGLEGNLHVTLPGMDAAVLPLGSMRWWAAGVQWSGCQTGANEAGWACEIAMEYQSERSSQGAVKAIYRNGVLRASANQPAIRQQSLTFKLGALYRFN